MRVSGFDDEANYRGQETVILDGLPPSARGDCLLRVCVQGGRARPHTSGS